MGKLAMVPVMTEKQRWYIVDSEYYSGENYVFDAIGTDKKTLAKDLGLPNTMGISTVRGYGVYFTMPGYTDMSEIAVFTSYKEALEFANEEVKDATDWQEDITDYWKKDMTDRDYRILNGKLKGN